METETSEEVGLENEPADLKQRIAELERQLELAKIEKRNLQREVEYTKANSYSLFEQAPALIALLKGPDGIVELFNPEFSKLWGHRDVIGKPMRQAWPELEGQGYFEIVHKVYTKGEPIYGNEYPGRIDRHNTGELDDAYFNFVYFPYRNGRGEIEGVLIHGIDVTEQVKARQIEEQLRQSEERFRLVQEMSPDGFSIMRAVRDAKGALVDFVWDYINALGEKLVGAKLEQVKGKSVNAGFPNFITSGLFDLYKTVVESGRSHQMELYYEGDGIKGWYWLTLVKLDDGLAISYVDITDRKRREEQLEILADAGQIFNQSLDYTDTLEKIGQLIIAKTADLCSVDLYNEKSGQLERVTMLTNNAEKSGIYKEIFNKYTSRQKIAAFQQVMEQGQPILLKHITDEVRRQAAMDEGHYELLKQLNSNSGLLVPLRCGNRTLGIMAVGSLASRRVYDEKDVEFFMQLGEKAANAIENARLYRQAQQAVHEREEFLSIAAHELKTPVTSLRGYAQLLIRQLDKNTALDETKLRHALEVIDRQTGKLTRLIGQLLDVSRLEMGRLALEKKPVDLVHLLQEVTGLAQLRSGKHRLRLDSNVAQLEYNVDPYRLEQAITNLLDNAIKFSPQGGDIMIELCQNRINNGQPENITISISDAGVGIEPERRPYVFDRFHQVKERSHLEGMGLGLYLTQQIIELHGGTIKLEETENNIGSRFVITM
jgi:signal transduction histidine kinase/PAS domain-containing protein